MLYDSVLSEMVIRNKEISRDISCCQLACWKDPMTEKSRGRTLHVIPRKVAKRACAVPFPTNLSALTNRSATPCVVGEIHLRRSSSLKTNARPTWAPRGPPFHVGGRDGYGILGPWRTMLLVYFSRCTRWFFSIVFASPRVTCRWITALSSKSLWKKHHLILALECVK